MATTVYITCNPIHILYSLAINKTTYSNKEYFIMWFGAMPVENYFKPFEIKKYCRIIDLSHLNFNHFFAGVRKNYNKYLEILDNNIKKIDYLFTCFDTHMAFEVVRHHYSVKWSCVGIIEDGIGNYYKNTHPKLIRQIPKSLFNKIKYSYFLNITKNNLGGNPKVGIISTLCIDQVYKNKKSKAKILPILSELKVLLNEITIQIPEGYKNSDGIIFLSPVLVNRRMTKYELIQYINNVNDKLKSFGCNKIMIKPHPREDIDVLKDIIQSEYSKTIIIADQRPIELYMPQIRANIWAGMPSTGMFNNYLLNRDENTKYLIFPPFYSSSAYLNTCIKKMKNIMGDSLTVYNQLNDLQLQN